MKLTGGRTTLHQTADVEILSVHTAINELFVEWEVSNLIGADTVSGVVEIQSGSEVLASENYFMDLGGFDSATQAFSTTFTFDLIADANVTVVVRNQEPETDEASQLATIPAPATDEPALPPGGTEGDIFGIDVGPVQPSVSGSEVAANVTVTNTTESRADFTLVWFIDDQEVDRAEIQDHPGAFDPEGGVRNYQTSVTAPPPGDHNVCARVQDVSFETGADPDPSITETACELFTIEGSNGGTNGDGGDGTNGGNGTNGDGTNGGTNGGDGTDGGGIDRSTLLAAGGILAVGLLFVVLRDGEDVMGS